MIPRSKLAEHRQPKSIWKRGAGWVKRKVIVGGTSLMYQALLRLPCFHAIRNTACSQNPCRFKHWIAQRILRINGDVYWPVHFASRINEPRNIHVGVDCAPGYEPGCYIQGIGPIVIGDYTQVAANVGIIGANHNVHDLRAHTEPKGVSIGKYCWLGMGCIILPGVTLGDFTIVGANAVVTKSYPDGYCVLAGSPAVQIRKLDPESCLQHRAENEYHGFIRKEDFPDYRLSSLWI
ncbi:acyltransferase [Neorhodopirellula pilleata]|uniref:Maltose O-acetyltransferase n=1 Tax=Neorhodopirellula pilleata TaxID=2714738 RepID=A0A5C6A8B6_9BACT|nr:acyltransferase [Neorhodopirellula pilleata]TWT96262.1 Maltose O-acetyltransferase [Neorhodopirellula pilleata]